MLNISMLGNLTVQLQPCCAVTGCCDAAEGAGFVNRVTGYSLPASSFDGPTHLILKFLFTGMFAVGVSSDICHKLVCLLLHAHVTKNDNAPIEQEHGALSLCPCLHMMQVLQPWHVYSHGPMAVHSRQPHSQRYHAGTVLVHGLDGRLSPLDGRMPTFTTRYSILGLDSHLDTRCWLGDTRSVEGVSNLCA
jgi:hypothetical protein